MGARDADTLMTLLEQAGDELKAKGESTADVRRMLSRMPMVSLCTPERFRRIIRLIDKYECE